MRIVGGAWRGRTLVAPSGRGTRPTADRVRQALFDMLMHAEWGGRPVIENAIVLDVFAGTGALGLEALSRGAASACFVEHDAAALKALHANVAACGAGSRTAVVAGNALAKPRWPPGLRTDPAGLVFLDPPYGQDLVPRTVVHFIEVGVIKQDALIIAETSRDDAWVPGSPVLAERTYGAARVLIFRLGDQ